MKKSVILVCSVLMLIGCKNQSEEVKSDETIIDNPADTIAVKDTVAVLEPVADEQSNTAPEVNADQKPAVPIYASFGKKINSEKALSKDEMLRKYKNMKSGDTIAVKFNSRIKEVCKKKGCWMSLELPNGKESFVRFKDYGFFVPLNADNAPAIVSGKAYLDVVSVAQLQHYAKDGGKSQEEIDKIIQPKITYAFQADGVLIQE